MDTVNQNIECSVNSCAFHKEHHCTLNAIKVGCCQSKVCECGETECASFQMGDHGADCGCK